MSVDVETMTAGSITPTSTTVATPVSARQRSQLGGGTAIQSVSPMLLQRSGLRDWRSLAAHIRAEARAPPLSVGAHGRPRPPTTPPATRAPRARYACPAHADPLHRRPPGRGRPCLHVSGWLYREHMIYLLTFFLLTIGFMGLPCFNASCTSRDTRTTRAY